MYLNCDLYLTGILSSPSAPPSEEYVTGTNTYISSPPERRGDMNNSEGFDTTSHTAPPPDYDAVMKNNQYYKVDSK